MTLILPANSRPISFAENIYKTANTLVTFNWDALMVEVRALALQSKKIMLQVQRRQNADHPNCLKLHPKCNFSRPPLPKLID